MFKTESGDPLLSLAHPAAAEHHEPVPPDPLPAPPAPPSAPQLSVAATARRLGIAPATLRTWDRRYGLGPSEHSPGSHRRYSPRDLARLELMQRALVQGASPADAARYATATPLDAPPGPGHRLATSVDRDPVGPSGAATRTVSTAGSITTAGPLGATDPARPLAAGSVATTGASVAGMEGNGHIAGVTLRLPGAGRRAHGLARAALGLDPVAIRGLLTESIELLGVEPTWDDVVRPVLRAVGERWAHSGTDIEIEHLLGECVTGAFTAAAVAAVIEPHARPVLLAGMPGEQHVLPMVVLSAALATRGRPCRVLGANLPVDALCAAVRRTAPSVVVLWAQNAGTADSAALVALPRTRPRFRTFVAGPGWTDVDLPPRVGWLGTLVSARAAISEATPVWAMS